MCMNDKLIEQLSKYRLEETSIKRELDRNYRSDVIRTRMFKRLKFIKKEQERLKFRLRLEKEIKNDKDNNTD